MSLMPTEPTGSTVPPPVRLDRDAIQNVVLRAMTNANLARDGASQLETAPDAPIFGPDSPLDSLGLVALLLDIEEGLHDAGWDIVISDERAVSQKRSPFRNVPSLVSYIESLVHG